MAQAIVTQSYGSSIKGVLGKKLGMTQIFDANNKMIPVTVVAVDSLMRLDLPAGVDIEIKL